MPVEPAAETTRVPSINPGQSDLGVIAREVAAQAQSLLISS
jgi:hypothetical protein